MVIFSEPKQKCSEGKTIFLCRFFVYEGYPQQKVGISIFRYGFFGIGHKHSRDKELKNGGYFKPKE